MHAAFLPNLKKWLLIFIELHQNKCFFHKKFLMECFLIKYMKYKYTVHNIKIKKCLELFKILFLAIDIEIVRH